MTPSSEKLDPEAREHPVQRVAVRVVHLALAERCAYRAKLVPGRKERDAQAPLHAHLGHAERADHAEFRRAHQRSGIQHRNARLEILSRGAHVLFLLLPGGNRDAAPFGANDFLDHHRIGALRHHRAGHDAHALARTDTALEHPAGKRAADLLEDDLGVRLQVGAAHRVAIHRRIVVRRDIDRGHDALREHAAERGAKRHPLAAFDRREAGANRLARLVHVQRLGVVAVQAADDAGNLVHASRISSSVLMLRNASASSSKDTSATFSVAYQASILRPPAARNASRCGSTARITSENTGCG